MEYKELYLPGHHRAKTNGYVDEHILVAERKIGRELRENEVVHHLDSTRTNNAPENIIVFVSNSAHVGFHHGVALVPTDEPGVFDAALQPDRHCGRCGRLISGKHLCAYCYALSRPSSDKPSRESLLVLLESVSIAEIARRYNLSSTSIRKWAKGYGLLQ